MAHCLIVFICCCIISNVAVTIHQSNGANRLWRIRSSLQSHQICFITEQNRESSWDSSAACSHIWSNFDANQHISRIFAWKCTRSPSRMCVSQKKVKVSFSLSTVGDLLYSKQRPSLWVCCCYDRGQFSPEFQLHLINWLWRKNGTAVFWCPVVICIITFIQQGLNWKHAGHRLLCSPALMLEPRFFLHTRSTLVCNMQFIWLLCAENRICALPPSVRTLQGRFATIIYGFLIIKV